jgi:hypothetical protein
VLICFHTLFISFFWLNSKLLMFSRASSSNKRCITLFTYKRITFSIYIAVLFFVIDRLFLSIKRFRIKWVIIFPHSLTKIVYIYSGYLLILLTDMLNKQKLFFSFWYRYKYTCVFLYWVIFIYLLISDKTIIILFFMK